MTNNLPDFIKQLRKENNLTQEYVASEIGISRPTYEQIEKGKRELKISEAEKLAKIFNIPLENFLQGKKGVKITVDIKNGKRKNKKEEEIRISIPQKNIEKFHQILLYILRKVGGKPNVGMTVIYKLLYFIDFDYYEKYENQLMGLVYVKNHHGPTPTPFKEVVDDMIEKKEIEIVKSKFYKYPQTKYLINPLVKPDLSILSGEEKEHIDWELERLSNLTATQLSALSHKDVPFITAQEGKPLDYESVFYRTKDTSVREYPDEE